MLITIVNVTWHFQNIFSSQSQKFSYHVVMRLDLSLSLYVCVRVCICMSERFYYSIAKLVSESLFGVSFKRGRLEPPRHCCRCCCCLHLFSSTIVKCINYLSYCYYTIVGSVGVVCFSSSSSLSNIQLNM